MRKINIFFSAMLALLLFTACVPFKAGNKPLKLPESAQKATESELVLGDCVANIDDFIIDYEGYVIPCDELHDGEVIAVYDLGETEYANSDEYELDEMVDEACYHDYSLYLGAEYPYIDAEYTFGIPNETSWTRSGSEPVRVVCYGYSLDGMVKGSMLGIGS